MYVTVVRLLHYFSILWFQVFGTGQDHSRRPVQVQDGGLAPHNGSQGPPVGPLHIFHKINGMLVSYYRYVYRWGPRAEVCVDKRKVLALVAEVSDVSCTVASNP